MSNFKTIAYDYIKLFPPKKLSISVEELPTHIDRPYVNVSRERMRLWANDYKVLYEFVAEVLNNREFTHWDIVDWYRKRADELEKKARSV